MFKNTCYVNEKCDRCCEIAEVYHTDTMKVRGYMGKLSEFINSIRKSDEFKDFYIQYVSSYGPMSDEVEDAWIWFSIKKWLFNFVRSLDLVHYCYYDIVLRVYDYLYERDLLCKDYSMFFDGATMKYYDTIAIYSLLYSVLDEPCFSEAFVQDKEFELKYDANDIGKFKKKSAVSLKMVRKVKGNQCELINKKGFCKLGVCPDCESLQRHHIIYRMYSGVVPFSLELISNYAMISRYIHDIEKKQMKFNKGRYIRDDDYANRFDLHYELKHSLGNYLYSQHKEAMWNDGLFITLTDIRNMASEWGLCMV